MKKFLFAAFMLALTIPAWSGTLYDVWMQKQTGYSWPNPKGEYEEPEEEGRKKPARPFICTIDETSGIEFSNSEVEEILTYEIYDEQGFCVGIFTDEMDFIECLFSLSGGYKIVFTTDEYDLVGVVWL